MKRIITPVVTLAFAAIFAITGCKKSEAPAPEPAAPKAAAPAPVIVSAEKTSFQEVTSHLDPGGEVYLYASTAQLLEGVSGKVGGLRQMLGGLPDVKAEDRENLNRVFDVVTNLIKSSGIEDVSGFGLSSIAREKNLYHSKALLHHYPGKGSGFLWNLFGQKPHAFNTLDFLPADTAFATFSDLDVALLWSVIKQQAAQSGIPQAEEMLNKLPEGFEQATGLKWDRVLASLGGEFGFVVSLDSAKKVSIPVPGGDPLEVPSPALMIVMKVKDDTIFNRVDEALKQSGQQVFSTDKPNLKMRSVGLPLPLPIQLSPTIALSDGYLYIASNDLLVQEALAVKAGQKKGLKSTEEFQRLAKDVPTQGNNFTFVSQRLGQTLNQLQQQALPFVDMAPEAQRSMIKSLLNSDRSAFSYSVGANTDEGWLAAANGSQHPAKMLMVSAAIPIGTMAAIAIPNFVKARQAAQANKNSTPAQ